MYMCVCIYRVHPGAKPPIGTFYQRCGTHTFPML